MTNPQFKTSKLTGTFPIQGYPGRLYVVGIDVPFENGWTVFDAPRVPTFYKQNGRVYIDGLIAGGALGATVWTLPEGFRPNVPATRALSIDANTVHGRMLITAAGAVSVQANSNTAIFLEGDFLSTP